ncbi:MULTISPECIES: arabinose transporter [unclassified Rhizobium]|jgi:MFS family permease|uniref:arabinose transporter n=1 Tax=unclassified Rhizobium TaxID=2613769 RepID=UPI0006492956|nr:MULTISPECIES: arabinose transporter [unclassified Rhizobium]MBN8952982.1 arabinose transporter [Rhizobium tropici]OJY64686.1 MAG: arabinose transporter [Rhizobium sp. 60-20]RKD72447.1 putative MFS family arabinose efflux permease [Rhizobium sp. WW_1]
MAFQSTPDPARGRLLLLSTILFISYLCIGMSFPIVPLYVSEQLRFGNVWAGLGVGIAFFATILTRGYAGSLSDHRGAKPAVMRGLALYVAGALMALAAGLVAHMPLPSFLLLLVGRLLLGLGESLVAVGIIAWGIGFVGPARSGRVLALVGAAIYGALAVGGPIGLALFDRFGFAGMMAISAVLPLLGLLAIWRVPGIAPHPGAERPPFWSVIGKVWLHGAVVCLQGIGFAAIGAFFTLYFLDRGWNYAGLGLTAFGVGFVLMRVFFGHLPDRIGGLPVAAGSLVVEAVGQLLIWSAADPTVALAGAFLTGLGCSMIYPALGREVVSRVEPHLRGTALGGFSAFQDLAYGLTGPFAGLLADRAGYGSVFMAGTVAAIAGLLFTLSLRRMRAVVLN